MYDTIGIQQGWQCPLCKRIYAPFVTECFYCPRSGEQIMTTTGTNPQVARIKLRGLEDSITPDEANNHLTYTTLMEEPISPIKSTTAVNNHISDSAWISRIIEGEN